MINFFRSNLNEKNLGLILIGLGLIVLASSLNFEIVGDGAVRFSAISELVEQNTISPTKYSLVSSIFSIPFYWIGFFYKSPSFWCARYNYFIFIIGLIFSYKILSNFLDRGILIKFVLLLIIGSMFPHHLRHYYGEVFTTIFVFVGILGVTLIQTIWMWMFLILGIVNTPASIVGFTLVVLERIWTNKRLRYCLYLALTIFIIILESWVRRGNPLVSGYEGEHGYKTVLPYSGKPGFSYPFLFGLISILFSFGKGIFFYAPGLFLSIKPYTSIIYPSVYKSYRLWLYFLAGLVVVYARWWAWYGGVFWGPRFFLFASIPASFSVALCLHYKSKHTLSNLLTLIVLVWSIWVGVSGAVFGEANMGICFENNYQLEFLCWYVPEFSALLRPFVEPFNLEARHIKIIVYGIAVFIYLGFPILKLIINQITFILKHNKREYLKFKDWKF